jgi:hypothetical protein
VEGIPNTETGLPFDYNSSIYLIGVGIRGLDYEHALSLGMTLKMYRERMLEGRSSGIGVDLGGCFVTGNWTFAIRSGDIFDTALQWRGTTQEPLAIIPWTNRLAVSTRWFEDTVLATAEVSLERGYAPVIRLGTEVTGFAILRLSAGLSITTADTERATPLRLSAGFSLGPIRGMTVQYAYFQSEQQGMGTLPGAHVLSLEIAL